MGRSLVGISLGEVLEARSILEVEMAGLAAQRAGDDDLRAIEQNLQRMASRTKEHEALFVTVDADFHALVAKSARNRVLAELLLQVYGYLRPELHRVLEEEGVVERSLFYHRAIYEALRSRDVAEARRRMSLHMADIRARMMELRDSLPVAGGASDG